MQIRTRLLGTATLLTYTYVLSKQLLVWEFLPRGRHERVMLLSNCGLTLIFGLALSCRQTKAGLLCKGS
eukprot:scaffold424512_cov24-Prasinocladus_malaysianus.AAC.1